MYHAVPMVGRERRAMLCALLRGEPVAGDLARTYSELLDLAAAHRVDVLLAHVLERQPSAAALPDDLRLSLQCALRQEAVREWVQAIDLEQMLTVLAGEHVRPLLFKGVALGYTCYQEPFHRPHTDVDLLIRKEDVPVVRRVMDRAGYSQVRGVDGEQVTHQFQYAKRLPGGVNATYDFHWRIANPELFANLLSFDDVETGAVSLPALGGHARVPSDVHSLFISCIHRVAHHNDADDLIWLYDIHLLTGRLTPYEWREFERLAHQTRTCAVCAAGLERAAGAFGTLVPATIVEGLATAGFEPSAAFLGGTLRTIDVEMSSLRAIGGWRARSAFVWQHLFPKPAFVLSSYGVRRRLWLPALYVHRIIRGAIRWFRPLGGV